MDMDLDYINIGSNLRIGFWHKAAVAIQIMWSRRVAVVLGEDRWSAWRPSHSYFAGDHYQICKQIGILAAQHFFPDSKSVEIMAHAFVRSKSKTPDDYPICLYGDLGSQNADRYPWMMDLAEKVWNSMPTRNMRRSGIDFAWKAGAPSSDRKAWFVDIFTAVVEQRRESAGRQWAKRVSRDVATVLGPMRSRIRAEDPDRYRACGRFQVFTHYVPVEIALGRVSYEPFLGRNWRLALFLYRMGHGWNGRLIFQLIWGLDWRYKLAECAKFYSKEQADWLTNHKSHAPAHRHTHYRVTQYLANPPMEVHRYILDNRPRFMHPDAWEVGFWMKLFDEEIRGDDAKASVWSHFTNKDKYQTRYTLDGGILAYKRLVYDPVDCMFYSPSQGDPWDGGFLVSPIKPTNDNHCGIYTMKSPVSRTLNSYCFTFFDGRGGLENYLVEVEIGGVVLEGDEGFRSEEAVIRRVISPDELLDMRKEDARNEHRSNTARDRAS